MLGNILFLIVLAFHNKQMVYKHSIYYELVALFWIFSIRYVKFVKRLEI